MNVNVKVEGDKELLKTLEDIEKNFPKQAKSFVNKQVMNLKDIEVQTTGMLTVKRKGNLLKGIKVKDDNPNIKIGDSYSEYDKAVSSSAPHAHLIEDGHVIRGHRKKINGRRQRRGTTRVLTRHRARAFKPVEKSIEKFRPRYEADFDKFVEKMIKKLR